MLKTLRYMFLDVEHFVQGDSVFILGVGMSCMQCQPFSCRTQRVHFMLLLDVFRVL